MDSDSDEEVPKKWPRNYHLTSCVICGISGVCTKLTKPRDFESWTSLLNAAKIQNVEDIVKYEDVTEVPEIYYHTDCRRTFTHKNTLQRIQEETENPSISTPEHLKRTGWKGKGIILPPECMTKYAYFVIKSRNTNNAATQGCWSQIRCDCEEDSWAQNGQQNIGTHIPRSCCCRGTVSYILLQGLHKRKTNGPQQSTGTPWYPASLN